MEMDFEVMLCDFTDGVEVSSFLNLATQFLGRPPRPPPNTITATSSSPSSSATTSSTSSASSAATSAATSSPTSLPPFFNTPSFLASLQPSPKRGPLIATVLQSGSWHNHFPGDPRIQLSLPHLVSFYDTSLVPSLSALRAGKERWEHRLMGIGEEDVRRVMRMVEGAFGELGAKGEVGKGGKGRGSGVDWAGVIRVLGVRYAERLELVKHFVTTATTEETNTTENARRIQTQLRIMLTPYILFSASPPPSSSTPQHKNTTNTWAIPIYTHCASAHTRSLLSPSLQKRMTHAEKLMLRAVRGTEREICRVVVRMWAEGVGRGLDPVLKVGSGEGDVKGLMKWWKGEVDALMGWLDWSVWVKCVPACGFEEMCYLPTWPFFPRDGPPYNPNEPDEKDWVVPKPRCLRRVEPYEF
ncbi:hypothetical protein Hypma_006273 [Hypsizygus marmoreus]|uniref:Uncharacterized protein n=1 Tax=Hypsizygus marmoreus TaxID=39966 RepID=A0A369JZM5_HYPMA|nr:hypothetical protein Hypma_006273 [Hypsizygus marmoreus]